MSDDEARGPGGAPTKYEPEFAERAAKLCEQFNATDCEIADNLGVSVRTVYRWKAQHPEFCHAIKASKDIADDRIEQRLAQRALGFRVPACKVFMPAGAAEPVYAEYEEYIPPETKAMMFWLANRRPDRWRFRPEDSPGADQPPPASIRIEVVSARKDAPTD